MSIRKSEGASALPEEKDGEGALSPRSLPIPKESFLSFYLLLASIFYAIVYTQPYWEGDATSHFSISWWVPLALAPFVLLSFFLDWRLKGREGLLPRIFQILPRLGEVAAAAIAVNLYFAGYGFPTGDGGAGMVSLLRLFAAIAALLLPSLTIFFLVLRALGKEEKSIPGGERPVVALGLSLLSLFLFLCASSVALALQGFSGLDLWIYLVGAILSLGGAGYSSFLSFFRKGEGMEKHALGVSGAILGISFATLLFGAARFDLGNGMSALHLFLWAIGAGFGGTIAGAIAFYFLSEGILFGEEGGARAEERKEEHSHG